MEIWSPIVLSLQIALVSGVITLFIGSLLAYALTKKRFPGREFLDLIINIPLVLPPSVIGYYLLLLLGKRGLVGRAAAVFGWQILFTWEAAVVAAVVVALPLMVRSAKAGFESVERQLEQGALALGLTSWQTFRYITLPLAWRSLFSGFILAFTRSLGEFGATLMVAGNIPGKTQTISLAIYSQVAAGHYREANIMVAFTTVIAFAALWLISRWQGKGVFR